MPYWLFSTKKTTGSRQSSAMFMTSASTPWFTAPSPNIARATASSSRYAIAKASPTASGMDPPTMP